MNNGWHRLTDDEYNRVDALRSSDLAKLLKSPLHYYASKETPHTSTAAQTLGSLVHLMVLQPGEVSHRVKVYPSFNLRTNAGKEALAEFNKSVADDMFVVSEKEYNIASAIRDSVISHQAASKILTKGIAEVAGLYNGMKIKPDYRRFDGILVDLKTTMDASPKGFAKSVVNFNYYVQAAYYLDIANAIGEGEYHSFTWIAVEKEPPYACAVYVADNDGIELGRKKYKRALNIYNHAKKSGEWAGYPKNISLLKLPAYAFYEGEET